MRRVTVIARSVLVVFLAALGGGCMSYRTAERDLRPQDRVRATTLAPIELLVPATATSPERRCLAREVRGVVVDVRGDTLTLGAPLRVVPVRGASGCGPLSTVRYVATRRSDVDRLRFDTGHTLLAASSVVLVALVGFEMLILFTSDT